MAAADKEPTRAKDTEAAGATPHLAAGRCWFIICCSFACNAMLERHPNVLRSLPSSQFLSLADSVDAAGKQTLLSLIRRAAHASSSYISNTTTYSRVIQHVLALLDAGVALQHLLKQREAYLLQSSLMLSLLVGFTAPLRLSCIITLQAPGMAR